MLWLARILTGRAACLVGWHYSVDICGRPWCMNCRRWVKGTHEQ